MKFIAISSLQNKQNNPASHRVLLATQAPQVAALDVVGSQLQRWVNRPKMIYPSGDVVIVFQSVSVFSLLTLRAQNYRCALADTA
jgi:hypothetical protein